MVKIIITAHSNCKYVYMVRPYLSKYHAHIFTNTSAPRNWCTPYTKFWYWDKKWQVREYTKCNSNVHASWILDTNCHVVIYFKYCALSNSSDKCTDDLAWDTGDDIKFRRLQKQQLSRVFNISCLCSFISHTAYLRSFLKLEHHINVT